jgi:type IV secretion system protein VirB8
MEMFDKRITRSSAGAGAPSTTSRSGDVEKILQQAKDWEASQNEALERSEARAWKIVRVMSVITMLSVGALAVMAPFYKVIPAVFNTDRATGEVMQVITDPTTIEADELVTKNMLATYVTRRERYHWTLLDDDFDTVLQMSDESIARDYKAIYDGPNALDKRLGDGTDIRVKIVSVELSPNEPGKRGTVRWERRTRRNNQDVGGVERFSSTMSFKFAPPDVFKREKTLIANPMGFKVTGYAVASVLVNEGRK